MNNDLINYLNKIEDKKMFSTLINSYIVAFTPFNFYKFLQFLLENLNPLQAGYFSEVIISSNLPERLFNNNPIFLFTNVNELVNVLYTINKEKNLREFIKIVNFIKSHNIYFTVIFDILVNNLLENVIFF